MGQRWLQGVQLPNEQGLTKDDIVRGVLAKQYGLTVKNAPFRIWLFCRRTLTLQYRPPVYLSEVLARDLQLLPSHVCSTLCLQKKPRRGAAGCRQGFDATMRPILIALNILLFIGIGTQTVKCIDLTYSASTEPEPQQVRRGLVILVSLRLCLASTST